MRRPLPTIRRILRQAGSTLVDMSDSANLYLTPTQGRLYEGVLADSVYQKAVAGPLAEAGNGLATLLESVASTEADEPLTVIDCGPGTAEESVRKLRSLRGVVSVRRYVAVDVNSRLLSKVKTGVVAELGFPVSTIQKRFEELDSHSVREHAEGKVLLLFGSTCMNYEHSELIRLIRGLSFPGMLISMESMLRTREAFSSKEYESDAVIQFAFGPLGLLDAALEHFDFRSIAANGRVRLEFIAKRSVRLRHPKIPALRSGDRVWTAFSRRPTLLEYQQEISQIAARFDTFVLENRVAASLGQVV
jgi:Histidine-specific methyltransferase, SAM-dependent